MTIRTLSYQHKRVTRVHLQHRLQFVNPRMTYCILGTTVVRGA